MGPRCFSNVFLFVYPYCRMHCRYCIEPLTNVSSVLADNTVIMGIIGKLSEHGTRRIWLSGGEGSLSPYFLDYIEACREHGIEPRFSTQDGKRLSELAPFLKDIHIQLSLNGIREDHDYITQVGDSFEDLEKSIALLDETISLSARVIIRPGMENSPEDCVRWCEDLGIRQVFLSNISSGGKGHEYMMEPTNGTFSDSDFAALADSLAKKFPEMRIDTRYDSTPGNVCGVYSDGSVYVMPVASGDKDGRLLVGNLFAEGLDAIWQRFEDEFPALCRNYSSKILSDGTLLPRNQLITSSSGTPSM